MNTNTVSVRLTKHASKTDVPVLLIFFARPEIFVKVFDQVKKARPSKLFLYQDGPRENNPGDAEKIRNCRNIAEAIDWECEVHKFYQSKNVGCDPSEFIAQKWAFSMVDRCIVLEEDDVPAQSFFPFCAELLERFKDDVRINMICGMNHLGVSKENPHDYLFSVTGAIWGWASWKRVIDTWDEHYSFLDDHYAMRLLANLPPKHHDLGSFIRTAIQHRRSGKAYYETIFGASYLLNSRLNIVPTRNMISNIGIGADATHGSASLDVLPAGIRRVFNMKTHEIEFPLNHPKYVIADTEHAEGVFRIMGRGHPLVCRYRALMGRALRFKKKIKALFGL